MNRERQLAQVFVALSDTYAAEFAPSPSSTAWSTAARTCWTWTRRR
ncbi:hypothetical protein [Streptomyces sp. NPDC005423]